MKYDDSSLPINVQLHAVFFSCNIIYHDIVALIRSHTKTVTTTAPTIASQRT